MSKKEDDKMDKPEQKTETEPKKEEQLAMIKLEISSYEATAILDALALLSAQPQIFYSPEMGAVSALAMYILESLQNQDVETYNVIMNKMMENAKKMYETAFKMAKENPGSNPVAGTKTPIALDDDLKEKLKDAINKVMGGPPPVKKRTDSN